MGDLMIDANGMNANVDGEDGERAAVQSRVNEFEWFCASEELSIGGLMRRAEKLSWNDLRNSNFLHLLCNNKGVSDWAVEFVLEKYPGAACIRADWDWTDCEGRGAFPIHAACRNRYCSDSVIRMLAHTHPDALRQKGMVRYETYSVGGLPLHHYLARPSHIVPDTIQLLTETCDRLATPDDWVGYLPIHLFLENFTGGMHGIARYLLESNPLTIQAVNANGRLPLHAACFNINNDFETFQLLIDMWPGSTLQTDAFGFVPIHALCERFDFFQVADDAAALRTLRLFVKTSPAAVQQPNNMGILPIFWLIKYPKLFKELLDIFPESATIEMGGGLLIHRACKLGCVETVKYLLQSHPESIRAPAQGCLPIHIAAAYCEGEELAKKIELLLSMDPASALKATTIGNNNLPLHFICDTSDRGTTFDAAKILFDAEPEAISRRNTQGRLPLDLARMHDNPELVRFLEMNSVHSQRARDANALVEKDIDGLLHIHRAIQHNATLGAVKLLARANPASLEIPCDVGGDLPLHYACRGGNCDVVNFLLECRISCVARKNGSMKLPIHLLLESEEVDRESIAYVDTVWRLILAHPMIVSDWVARGQE